MKSASGPFSEKRFSFRLFIVIGRLKSLIFVSALLISCCTTLRRPFSPSEASPELVIVSTSDFHSVLTKAEGLASVVRDLKNRYGDQMLYLDGGDLFQGSLEGNLSKGKATVQFMNLLPLDAAAIGNHELDYGPDVPDRVRVMEGEDGLGNLKKRATEAAFSWLSANFIFDPVQVCDPAEETNCNALGQRTIFRPRSVVMRGGYKVGIIGATTATTAKITQPAFVVGTKFIEIDQLSIAEAAFLREEEGCDLILLLTHEGPRRNTAGGYRTDIGIIPVFKRIPEGTLDAAITGHSHIRVQEVIEKIPVLQSGYYGQVVGIMRIKGKERPRQISYEPWIDIPSSAVQPDVTETLAPFREAAAALKKIPIGKAIAPFPRTYSTEGALGNLIADAMRHAGAKAGGAHFSIQNAGGIRTDLPAGDLTYNDLFKVLPFENLLAIAELKGSELRRMLEIALSGAQGLASISGLRVTYMDVPPGTLGPWDRDLDGNGTKETWERNLVVSVQDENDKAIEDDQFYRIATIDYLTNGGDYQSEVFNRVPPERIRIYSEFPAREIVLEFIKASSPIDPDQYYTPKDRQLILVPALIE